MLTNHWKVITELTNERRVLINLPYCLPPSLTRGEKSFSERNDNGSKNRCVKQKINEFDNLHFLAMGKD